MVRTRIVAALMLSACAVATPASADLPNAATLLADLGYTPDQVEKVQAGEFVRGTIQPSGPRELVAAFAFRIQTSPADLVADFKNGLLDKVDPGNIAFGFVQGAGSPADFAKLTFGVGATARAAEYVKAQPGGPLNLSEAEIAASSGWARPVADSGQPAVISASGARAGLPGQGARGNRALRPRRRRDAITRRRAALGQPGDADPPEVRATRLLDAARIPNAKPLGTEETFPWTHFIAQDAPTIALTHSCFIPEGAAWIVVQRQFYVSAATTPSRQSPPSSRRNPAQS